MQMNCGLAPVSEILMPKVLVDYLWCQKKKRYPVLNCLLNLETFGILCWFGLRLWNFGIYTKLQGSQTCTFVTCLELWR